MTDLLCENCNNDSFKNSNNLNDYLNNIQKEIDNNICLKIVTNIDLNDVNKILNNYIEIHDKKFIVYNIKCIFDILFDDNDIYELETSYIHNKEIYKLIFQLQYFIDMILKTEGKNFKKINQMSIYILGDKCNMTDKYSKYMRFSSIERKINQLPNKNQLSNNILIKSKSHIIFNI